MTTNARPNGIAPRSSYELVKLEDTFVPTAERGKQRVEGIDEKRVAHIAENFNPDALGVFIISRRTSGALAVLDGAHRRSAAIRVGLKRPVRAIVFTGLSSQEEAKLFLDYNTKKDPSAVSKFLAKVASGDRGSINVYRIAIGNNWRISNQKGRRNILAVAALQSVYVDGAKSLPTGEYPELLDQVLKIITEAWGYDEDSVNRSIISGVGQVLGRYGEAVESAGLVRAANHFTPIGLLAAARNVHEYQGSTLAAAVASILVGRYNKRRRVNQIPDWMWTK